jgi:hypothetical protein
MSVDMTQTWTFVNSLLFRLFVTPFGCTTPCRVSSFITTSPACFKFKIPYLMMRSKRKSDPRIGNNAIHKREILCHWTSQYYLAWYLRLLLQIVAVTTNLVLAATGLMYEQRGFCDCAANLSVFTATTRPYSNDTACSYNVDFAIHHLDTNSGSCATGSSSRRTTYCSSVWSIDAHCAATKTIKLSTSLPYSLQISQQAFLHLK